MVSNEDGVFDRWEVMKKREFLNQRAEERGEEEEEKKPVFSICLLSRTFFFSNIN